MVGLKCWENVNFKFWKKKSFASRTFIDRMYEASSKFANWEPSLPIELGDYGEINKQTGKFDRVGNIFKDGKIDKVSELEIKKGNEDDANSYTSSYVKQLEFDEKLSAKIPAFADADLKYQLEFSHEYGAVLLMHRPSTSVIQGDLNCLLRDGQYEHLRGKVLVTEVVNCPSYALYLSAKKSETIQLSFGAHGPAIPGVSAGGEVGGKWHAHGAVGVLKHASQSMPSFTTLYYTKSISKGGEFRRGRNDSESADTERWMKSVLPWNPLDPDGKEIY